MKPFHLLIVPSLLFICNSLCAQKRSIPGCYITIQGDTVKGVFPGYTQWGQSPSQVEFNTGTSQLQLTPHNAKKFVVEGYDEYLSYTGKRLINPIEDAALFNEMAYFTHSDSTQHVTTFLRLVNRTTGADLYLLNDGKRRNFFYQLPGGAVTELRYKKIVSQNQIREIADFRQQLSHLFSALINNKNLTSTLESLSYDEESLSSFFQDLFPDAKIKRKQTSIGTTWVVSAGAGLNMVSVDAEDYVGTVPTEYNTSFTPVLSAGLIIPIGRNFGRYFFFPQVKMLRYKNTGEKVRNAFIYSYTYQADVAVMAQVSAGINLLNREAHRVFVAGGIGLMAQVGGKEVRQIFFVSDRTTYNGPTEIKLSGLTSAIDVSAGAELGKKMLLTATYMVPTSIANFLYYSPKLSGVQVRIGYKL